MGSHVRALVVITGATALVGVLAAIAITAVLPEDDRTFAAVAAPVQLLMSVGVPFLGVVMTYDLDLQRADRGVLQTVVRALGLAILCGFFGSVVTAAAVAGLPSTTQEGRWADTLEIALGSLLVQVVATLTGTGLGLLIRRPVVASLLTIVIPLGLWLVLGPLAPQARPWVTPFDSANHLLSATMTPRSWLAFVVMICVWGVALNLAGIRRLSRLPVSFAAPGQFGRAAQG